MTQQSLPIRDIHLPEAVSWWPPALGWWLLPMLILMSIGAYVLYSKWQQKRLLKKSIVAEFEKIKIHFHENKSNAELARMLSALMRRICIQYLDRNSIASLTGKAWLATLDQLHQSTAFSNGVGQILENAPYQAQHDFDAEALLHLCEQCIQQLPNSGASLILSAPEIKT